MKKILLLALCLMFVFSCVGCVSEPPAAPVEPEIQAENPTVLLPLVNEPQDFANGTFRVRFDEADLAKTDDGYTLQMDIFTYDLYDAVEVQNIEACESIVVCGEQVAIDAIHVVEELNSGLIEINGGLGEGFCLMPNGGGTYRTVTYNDYPLYFLFDSVTLPISEDVQVIDLSRHDETAGITDESLYPAEAIFGYAELEQAITDKTLWFEGATTVRTENGKIVNITRIWTP